MIELPFKRISIIGLGYIGLPTAAMFASHGVEVIGVDVDQNTVDIINKGQVHIVEPNLDAIVRTTVENGYLRATTEPERAEAFLIAVPTPFKGENHEPDLSYIEAASRSIAPVLEPGNLVILESTSPVGTTEAMTKWIAEARPDLSFPQTSADTADIRIAHCPERVLPGNVMQELISNDRVIGGLTPACSALASKLYKIFVTGECIIATGPRVAEMAKLTENSFRDVNIAFANELSIICDELDMNVWELISLANRHPRVDILQPGPGVGGHCIAIDPWFIVAASPDKAKLIRAAREVNDSKPDMVIAQINSIIGRFLSANPAKSVNDVVIALYGLTFKANIDDLRESPALEIAIKIADLHPGRVVAVEPNVSVLKVHSTKLEHLELKQTVKQAHVHVLLVDHDEFKSLKLISDYVIDTRGIWQ